jgi:hypothetical protein
VLKKKNHKYQAQKLQKLFDFLVSKLSTHTGLDCIKNREMNISCLFPFKAGRGGGGEEGQIVKQS